MTAQAELPRYPLDFRLLSGHQWFSREASGNLILLKWTKYISGWWLTYPSEKYIKIWVHQLGSLCPIYIYIWKVIKIHVPNTNQHVSVPESMASLNSAVSSRKRSMSWLNSHHFLALDISTFFLAVPFKRPIQDFTRYIYIYVLYTDCQLWINKPGFRVPPKNRLQSSAFSDQQPGGLLIWGWHYPVMGILYVCKIFYG